MATQMVRQFLGHTVLASETYTAFGWKIAKSLGNLLPWVLLIPILWDKGLTLGLEPDKRAMLKGCRMGMIVTFVLINVMPGTVARYSLPLVPTCAVMIGWMLSLQGGLLESDKVWRKMLLVCLIMAGVSAVAMLIIVSHDLASFAVTIVTICAGVYLFYRCALLANVSRLTVATATLIMVLAMQYATFGTTMMKPYEVHRPPAMAVNKLVPAGETIYLYNSKYKTFYFYIRQPFKYLISDEQINKDVHYLVLVDGVFERLKTGKEFANHNVKVIYQFLEDEKDEYKLILLE